MIHEVSWGAWLDKRLSEGRSLFSLDEAMQETGTQAKAARPAMHRALREKRIAQVGDGFYVAVPPEFRKQGAPPYEWVVDARFARMGRRYYLGLLTAALHHGASHQKPMEMQVVTETQMRKHSFGELRIHPIFRKTWPSEDVLEKRDVRTGVFRLSGPELTLVDAVRYPAHAAGFDNIATLIREMGKKLRVLQLAKICRETEENSVLQRVGWMLKNFGRANLAAVVTEELKRRRIQLVPLESGNPERGRVDSEFKVRVNYEPEPDV